MITTPLIALLLLGSTGSAFDQGMAEWSRRVRAIERDSGGFAQYQRGHALCAQGQYKEAAEALEAVNEPGLAYEARWDAIRIRIDHLNEAPGRVERDLESLLAGARDPRLKARAQAELARVRLQRQHKGPLTRADGELHPPEDALGYIHRWDGATGEGVADELEAHATQDPRWGWVAWRVIGSRHTFEGRWWAAHRAFMKGGVDTSVRWVRLQILKRAIKPGLILLGALSLGLLGLTLYRRRRRARAA